MIAQAHHVQYNMAEVSDLSDLIYLNTLDTGNVEIIHFFKHARTNTGTLGTITAGRRNSLWEYAGSPGAAAAAGGGLPTFTTPPTTAAMQTDNTTVGGLLQTNPSVGKQKWLTQFWATGLVGGTLILYDRLAHCTGFVGTTTTQTLTNEMIPTRYTDGLGNFAFLEIHTLIGTTAQTATLSYTDQDDNNVSSVATTLGSTGFREAQRALMFSLAAGDTGIKKIQGITLSGSTGTAGGMTLVLGRPLAYVGVAGSGCCGFRDFTTGLPGLIEIKEDACLCLLWVPQNTSATEIIGGISMVEK